MSHAHPTHPLHPAHPGGPPAPPPVHKKNNKPAKAPRLRRSLKDVQDDYDSGKDPLQLENLVLAFKGIQELPWDHQHSFFNLGGYHGAPFRGSGRYDRAYWGGYCHHGNVLFPVWHRVYCLALEDALRSIKGCENVTLPYWDQTDEWALKNGLPWCVTVKEFKFKVHKLAPIPNPLRTFKLPVEIVDYTQPVDESQDGVRDIPLHSKPLGYEVERYPRSGLMGPEDKAETDAHNKKYSDHENNVKLLNQNVMNFMTRVIPIPGYNAGSYDLYLACLTNPNYTSFSNITSANFHDQKYKTNVVSLEEPHNMGHAGFGSFSFDGKTIGDIGAGGDMGTNETAGLDPVFYFHHCYVDYVFWQWQKIHKATDHLEILQDIYPGVTTLDFQGPSAGFAPGVFLDMDFPLTPFTKPDGTVYIGKDTFNIFKMGYDYDKGSLASKAPKLPSQHHDHHPKKIIEVLGIDKSGISGSFMVNARAVVNGEKILIGAKFILSRWNVHGCINCQAHLETKVTFRLPQGGDEDTIEIEVIAKGLKVKIDKKDSVAPKGNLPTGFGRFQFHVHTPGKDANN